MPIKTAWPERHCAFEHSPLTVLPYMHQMAGQDCAPAACVWCRAKSQQNQPLSDACRRIKDAHSCWMAVSKRLCRNGWCRDLTVVNWLGGLADLLLLPCSAILHCDAHPESGKAPPNPSLGCQAAGAGLARGNGAQGAEHRGTCEPWLQHQDASAKCASCRVQLNPEVLGAY